jgi:hypothetical protein
MLKQLTNSNHVDINDELAHGLKQAAQATSSLKLRFPDHTKMLAESALNVQVHIADAAGATDPLVVLTVSDNAKDFTCTWNRTAKLSAVETLAAEMWGRIDPLLHMLRVRHKYILLTGHDLPELTLETVRLSIELSELADWVLGHGTARFDASHEMLDEARMRALEHLYQTVSNPEFQIRACTTALDSIRSNRVDADNLDTAKETICFTVVANDTGITFAFSSYLVQLKTGLEEIDFDVHLTHRMMKRHFDLDSAAFQFAMSIHDGDVKKAMGMALEKQDQLESLDLPTDLEC